MSKDLQSSAKANAPAVEKTFTVKAAGHGTHRRKDYKPGDPLEVTKAEFGYLTRIGALAPAETTKPAEAGSADAEAEAEVETKVAKADAPAVAPETPARRTATRAATANNQE